ncbi:MAG: hypothetical protein IPL61_15955 [Myxococcales bacterium]|nr:hypothetical protein [Myxococcales bacterium]
MSDPHRAPGSASAPAILPAGRRAHGPRPPGRRWLRRLVTFVTAGLVAVAVGVLAAVLVVKRMRTGTWQPPTVDDLADVKRAVVQRIDPPPPPPVPRVIFLDRSPRTISPGVDDAAVGVSSVIAHQGDLPRSVPGWKGTAKGWKDLVACVQKMFAPFDVVVTDQPPTTPEHILVAVGGRPKDIGVKDAQVAGLAPFSGEVIPRAVVFAFAATQSHQAQGVCETLAMEVAHAYGLDHEYLCSDVMSYLRPCGKRKFVDKDARCGEKKARDCAGGAPTQNSHRRLLSVLGPPAPATPPTPGKR